MFFQASDYRFPHNFSDNQVCSKCGFKGLATRPCPLPSDTITFVETKLVEEKKEPIVETKLVEEKKEPVKKRNRGKKKQIETAEEKKEPIVETKLVEEKKEPVKKKQKQAETPIASAWEIVEVEQKPQRTPKKQNKGK